MKKREIKTDMGQKINVLLIENNTIAMEPIRAAFDSSDKYNLSCTRISTKDSNEMAISRAEHKSRVMERLKKFDYKILILDLLLRDEALEEPDQLNEDLSGANKLLSIELLYELESELIDKDIMILFTSSSRKCNTKDDFEQMKKKNEKFMSQKWEFIFKPEDEDKNEIVIFEHCPVYVDGNDLACGRTDILSASCKSGECFMKLLDKYYKEYEEA